LPATKDHPGALQVPVVIEGVEVMPGDGVFADDDGIVVVPRRHLAVAVGSAAAVEGRERAIATRLAAGDGTMTVLGLDESGDSVRAGGASKPRRAVHRGSL
jgi:4-hydroxy-4-methyl-2-oxoglutarate aldolase